MSAKTDWIAALPVVLFGLKSKSDSDLISPLAATAGLDVLNPTTVAEKTAPITLAFVEKLQDNVEQLASTTDITKNNIQHKRPASQMHWTSANSFGCASTEKSNVWKDLTPDLTSSSKSTKTHLRQQSRKTTTMSSSAFNASNHAQYHLIEERT